MLKRAARLFVIKTRFDACAVIYALAVGAVERGFHYLQQYPGPPGYLLFVACLGAVFMAGAKILDAVPRRRRREAAVAGERRLGDRRAGDRRQPPARPA